MLHNLMNTTRKGAAAGLAAGSFSLRDASDRTHADPELRAAGNNRCPCFRATGHFLRDARAGLFAGYR